VRFHATELPEVILIERDLHGDARGWLAETFDAQKYAAAGIRGPFVLDLQTRSQRGVLRGLHFQEPHPQGKLVEAVRGAIFDVVVDVRRSSPRFGRWLGFELTGENHRQLWIPPGFAHGFCVVSDDADVLYKLDAPFVPEAGRNLAWDDPALGIAWPVKEPIMSAKDRMAVPLNAQAHLPA
jgi:dTDP-4-dehydrorhamnose 3,5-epimerase